MIDQHMWEVRWLALKLLGDRTLSHMRPGSSTEWTVDHLMCDLLERSDQPCSIDSAAAQMVALVCPELPPPRYVPSEELSKAPRHFVEAPRVYVEARIQLAEAAKRLGRYGRPNRG